MSWYFTCLRTDEDTRAFIQAAVVACLEVVADRLPEGGHEADGLEEAGVATIPKDTVSWWRDCS